VLQDRNTIADSTQRQNMVLTPQNNIADPVGRLIGGNPPTDGTIPDGTTLLEQMLRAATGQKDTSHNCYGNPMAPNNCGGFWMNSPDKKAITLPVNMEGKD
jgi:filamentous hemagglutinin